MKLILGVLLSVVSFAAAAEEFVAGSTVREGRAATPVINDPAKTCATASGSQTFCSKTPSCDKDAEYFICVGTKPTPLKKCADPTPYCSGDPGAQTCSADPDDGCATSSYNCPGVGYYPNPSNCYEYYYCYYDDTIGDIVGVKKTCPSGYPFTPVGPGTQKCGLGKACLQATCRGTVSEWRTLSYAGATYRHYGLYCNAGKQGNIYACPAGLSIDVNSKAVPKCILVCLSTYQKAIYLGDNTKYYQCYGNKAYVEDCEYKKIFDPETATCIDAPVTTTTVATTTTGEATTTTDTTTTTTDTTTSTTDTTTTTTLGP